MSEKFNALIARAKEIAAIKKDPSRRMQEANDLIALEETVMTLAAEPEGALDVFLAGLGAAKVPRKPLAARVNAYVQALSPDDESGGEKPGKTRTRTAIQRIVDSGKEAPKWLRLLTTTERGQFKGTLHNAITVLSHDESWKGVFGYDQLKARAVVLKCPPWRNPSTWTSCVEVDDVYDSMVTMQVERDWEVSVESSNMTRAIDVVARANSFHPVRDYLNGVVWDGAPRLDTMLVTYAGAANTAVNRAFASRWMISAVARAMTPGVKVDTALILIGGQGQSKSTFFRVLGGEWFSDQTGTIGEKSAKEELVGNWIIELPELAATTRASIESVKAFMSQQEDDYRESYGRRKGRKPRQCAFGGTTNDEMFLRDPTGGRRWWPVKTTTFDIDALKRDRDQLWAEALHRFKAGERHWFDKRIEADEKLWDAVEAAQEDVRVRSPWEEILSEALGANEYWVSSQELLNVHLKIGVNAQKPYHLQELSHTMRHLGWYRAQRRIDGKKVRGYLRNGFTLNAEGKVFDPEGKEPLAELIAQGSIDFTAN